MRRKKTWETLLFELGFGSRRECRRLIRSGAVSRDGTEVIQEPDDLYPTDLKEFRVSGELVEVRTELYLLLHKPAGYECSHAPQHHPSVFNLLPSRYVAMGLQTAGRLDADTTGALLLSNDGLFIHHVESPRKGVDKVYRVDLEDGISSQSLDALRSGVRLRGETRIVKPSWVEPLGVQCVRVAIREGCYHQVKRMFAAVGSKVKCLHRETVGELGVDHLSPGAWRHLDERDFSALGWKVSG